MSVMMKSIAEIRMALRGLTCVNDLARSVKIIKSEKHLLQEILGEISCKFCVPSKTSKEGRQIPSH